MNVGYMMLQGLLEYVQLLLLNMSFGSSGVRNCGISTKQIFVQSAGLALFALIFQKWLIQTLSDN